MRLKMLCLPLFMLAMCLWAAPGCEAFNDDDDDDRTRERVESGQVPRTASIVESGEGELSYRAEADGAVYLFDVSSRRLLDSERVRKGQRYTVDPRRSLATIDGKEVFDGEMNREHEHRLYFDRATDRD